MKEVKVLSLFDVSDGWKAPFLGNSQKHEQMENNLADWLNKGWKIAGTGGANVYTGYVILVRDG